MRNITIFIWILTLTICNFCGNDFLVIGRHSWRCKARSRSSSVNDDIVTNGNTSNMDHASLYLDNQHNNQSSSVVMCGGKHCKGYKGLKIHQRSCKFIFGLREDLTKTLLDHVVENHERPGYSETEELNNSNQSESNTSDHSNVKNGVKLPKTSDLKTLKSSDLENNLTEVRFVSKLLRSKFRARPPKKILATTKLITTNRLTQDSGVIVKGG